MKISVIVRGRDVLTDNSEAGPPNKESIKEILAQLKRRVPERLMKLRAALRKRDRKKCEIELLKLTAKLPPLVATSALLPDLPSDREPTEEEWSDARQRVQSLERLLEQLAEDLKSVLVKLPE